MIVTSSRRNVIEVTYVEPDHSESRTNNHPLDVFGVRSYDLSRSDMNNIVTEVMEYEYSCDEVVSIYYIDGDGRRESLYLGNGIDY